MPWIRKRGLAAVAAAGIGAVFFALAPHEPPLRGTPLGHSHYKRRPLVTVEDGTPVLEEQGKAPQELFLEIADEPVRLIDEVEAIDRPDAIQRLAIPRTGIDSAVAQSGITRRNGGPVYETVVHVPE